MSSMYSRTLQNRFIGNTFLLLLGAVLCSNLVMADVSLRENYYPNTEQLGADEMRIIALGTGTPNFRKSQASSSWLVELGNGEKFIFDMGSGSLGNLAALEIPYSYHCRYYHP